MSSRYSVTENEDRLYVDAPGLTYCVVCKTDITPGAGPICWACLEEKNQEMIEEEVQ